MKDAERALRRLDGVRDIEADIGGMTVTVRTAKDRTLDLAAVRPTLAAEGVRMRRLVISADGEVETTPEGSRFRIIGWTESYALEGDVPPTGPARIRAVVTVHDGQPLLRVD